MATAARAKKLVIGASCCLGSHVTRQLVAAGDDVRVMLRRSSSTKGIDDLAVERCYGDLFDDDVAGNRPLHGYADGVPQAAARHRRKPSRSCTRPGPRRALAAAGGPDLDREDLWLRYRQGALYGYVAPLITAGMGGMQVEDIAMEGLRRGVAALDDLEAVAVLKNSIQASEIGSARAGWRPPVPVCCTSGHDR